MNHCETYATQQSTRRYAKIPWSVPSTRPSPIDPFAPPSYHEVLSKPLTWTEYCEHRDGRYESVAIPSAPWTCHVSTDDDQDAWDSPPYSPPPASPPPSHRPEPLVITDVFHPKYIDPSGWTPHQRRKSKCVIM